MPEKHLVWLDLETTGLIAGKHRILEVYAAVAPLMSPYTVKSLYHAVLPIDAADAQQLDPFIIDMHTKNGLLSECMAESEVVACTYETSISSIENDLLSLVPEVEDKESRWCLAGNSVHFDLGFIRAEMPTLAKRLSHRVYDTSAILMFALSLGMPKPEKREPHRAAADVNESMLLDDLVKSWLRENGFGVSLREGTRGSGAEP